MINQLVKEYVDSLDKKGLAKSTLRCRRWELNSALRGINHIPESIIKVTEDELTTTFQALAIFLRDKNGIAFDAAYRKVFIVKEFLEFHKVEGATGFDAYAIVRTAYGVKDKPISNRYTVEQMREYEEFMKDPTIQGWWSKTVGRKCQRAYSYAIWRFCKWAKMTPTQLWRERADSVKKNGVVADHFVVHNEPEQRVLRYVKYVEKTKKLHGATTRKVLDQLLNFYRNIKQPLDSAWLKSRIKKVRSEGTPFRREDLQRMLAYTESIRDKAIITTMAGSGLSASDICALTIGDLTQELLGQKYLQEKTWKDLEAPIFIKKPREKTKIEIRTFIAPDAWELIKRYLHMREEGIGSSPHEHGWRYKEEITDESPVFATHLTSFGSRRSLSPRNISYIFNRATKRAGIYKKWRGSHGDRRYFNTRLEKLGVPHNWIEIMMGHALPANQEGYSKPTDHELREKYIEVMPELMIQEGYVIKTKMKETEERANEYKKRLVWFLEVLKEDPEAQEYFERALLKKEKGQSVEALDKRQK